MSLLPIIYTSLIIFTGFAIFVISLSYISYKIRQRNNSYVNPTQVPLGDNMAYSPQPVASAPQYYQQQVDSFEENVRQMEVSKPVIRKKTRTVQPITEKRIFREHPLNTNSLPHLGRNHVTRERTGGKRFNVLNSNIAMPYKKAANSDIDFNILNYYSDDENINFPPTYTDFN